MNEIALNKINTALLKEVEDNGFSVTFDTWGERNLRAFTQNENSSEWIKKEEYETNDK